MDLSDLSFNQITSLVCTQNPYVFLLNSSSFTCWWWLYWILIHALTSPLDLNLSISTDVFIAQYTLMSHRELLNLQMVQLGLGKYDPVISCPCIVNIAYSMAMWLFANCLHMCVRVHSPACMHAFLCLCLCLCCVLASVTLQQSLQMTHTEDGMLQTQSNFRQLIIKDGWFCLSVPFKHSQW